MLSLTATCKALRQAFNPQIEKIMLMTIQERFLDEEIPFPKPTIRENLQLFNEMGFYLKSLFEVFGGLDKFLEIPIYEGASKIDASYQIENENITHPIMRGKDKKGCPFLIFKLINHYKDEKVEFEVIGYSHYRSKYIHWYGNSQQVTLHGACDAFKDESIFLTRIKKLLEGKPVLDSHITIPWEQAGFKQKLFKAERDLAGTEPMIKLWSLPNSSPTSLKARL